MATAGKALLIRADASGQIGTGHVMRCLALAQAWQDHGGTVTFLAAEIPPALVERLGAEGFAVQPVQAKAGSLEDATQTTAAARSRGAEWIVVDGYQFGSEYQRAIKEGGHRVLFFDDFGHGAPYCADLVLNQNVSADPACYVQRAAETQVLLGPRYVLLRREFTERAAQTREFPATAKRILVTMGGSDPENMTQLACDALGLLPADFQAKVVVGPGNRHPRPLPTPRDTAAGTIQWLQNVAGMADLMAWADVALSAAGTTCWELAFLGVPMLLVVLADNQEAVAGALGRSGVAKALGRAGQLTANTLSSQLQLLLDSAQERQRMSELGRRLVDGEGSQRIVATMMNRPIRVRPMRPDDCQLVWQWANDPVVRQNSFSTDTIPWDTHVAWFQQQLANPQVHAFIAVDSQDAAVGQVRFQVAGDVAVISVSLGAEYRGQGYGAELLRVASTRLLRKLPQIATIHAFVRPENATSRRCFERAGFAYAEQPVVQPHPAVLLCLGRETL